MTDDLEAFKRRLVVGHKSDGRSVYDEAAESELGFPPVSRTHRMT